MHPRTVKKLDVRTDLDFLPEHVQAGLEQQQTESLAPTEIPVYFKDFATVDAFVTITQHPSLWCYGPLGGTLGVNWSQVKDFPFDNGDFARADLPYLERGYLTELYSEA